MFELRLETVIAMQDGSLLGVAAPDCVSAPSPSFQYRGFTSILIHEPYTCKLPPVHPASGILLTHLPAYLVPETSTPPPTARTEPSIEISDKTDPALELPWLCNAGGFRIAEHVSLP